MATRGFHAIAEGDALLRLPHARLCALVADDGLGVRCESSVFEAVVRWAGAVEPAPEAGQAGQAVQQAPIIQDGWQWDPVAHQWRPLDQAPPAPRAGDDDGRTQIRP